MSFEYDYEFYARVKHNFKLHVLLSSKRISWKEDDLLDSIYRLSGYKLHKTVKYGRYSSHIHVKFEKEYLAKEAVEFFNRMNSDLTAILVDDMLRDWFNYEMKSGFGPPCTHTIVDTVGNPPLGLNFLTSNVLDSILGDYGGPYLLPYTAALNEPHVQVLFASMSEALAACMAFGEWYVHVQGGTVKADSFSHRVRINPFHREAMLITNSGGVPSEAFKLDYFIILRPENFPCQRLESDVKQSRISRPKSSSQSKGPTQRVRSQKHTAPVFDAKPQSNLMSEIGPRTPILCVPVITPINYTDGFMIATRYIGADFSNAIMNFQQSCPVSTSAIVESVEPGFEAGSAIQSSSWEENLELYDGKKLDQPVPKEQASPTDPVPVESAPIPTKQKHRPVTKSKTTHKGQGQSKVIERRNMKKIDMG